MGRYDWRWSANICSDSVQYTFHPFLEFENFNTSP